MNRTIALLFVMLLGASPAFSQGTAPGSASPLAKISDMEWLQGYWVGEGFGGQVDEQWGAPRAGVMLGTFRSMKPDGSPAFYEILGIEEHEGSLRLVVKHFHPDWVGWEEKDQAFKAKLTRISPNEFVFGGVTLKRVGDSGLEVVVNIRRKDGTMNPQTLTLRRKPLP